MARFHFNVDWMGYFTPVLCAGLIVLFYFFAIRPLQIENDNMRREIARADVVAGEIRDVGEKYAQASLSLDQIKSSVLHTAARSFGALSLRTVHGDLGRLLSSKGLRIIAVEHAPDSDSKDDFFVKHESVWKLAGSFHQYVAFKEALTAYPEAVVHIAEEKVSAGKGGSLDIEMRLSIYQFESVRQ